MEEKNEEAFFKQKKFAKNLILADEKDRPYILAKIKERKEGELFFYEEGHLFSDVIDEIFQTSLFSPSKVFVLLDSEGYTDSQWEQLFAEQEAIVYSFKKSVKKSLLEKFQRSGAVLKLTEEKPWERKNRLVSSVIYSMHEHGIAISQPAAHRFVDRVHTDLHLFHGELTKLQIYAMGKKKLEEVDIDAIVKPLPEENAFKVAEEILWTGKYAANFTVDSISILLQAIGAFRYWGYLGLKMLSNERVNIPLWQAKKYKQKVDVLGPDFFKKLLITAFRVEERAKQTSISPAALFDLLVIETLALLPRHT